MLITRRSLISGIEHTLEVPITPEQWDAVQQRRTVIQNIVPDLPKPLREFLISGITPEEWNGEFFDRNDGP